MADDERKARHPKCPQKTCGRHQGWGKCASCEALEERDRFVAPFGSVIRILRGGIILLLQSLLKHWLAHAQHAFQSHGYLIFVALAGAYVGLYAIVEARHERQLNRALFAQNRFMTLAASGNPGGLNAALAEYETLKDMDVLDEPSFWRFWKWGVTRKENEDVLKRWAQKFFRGCPENWCGQGLDLTVLGNGDLKGADPVGANLQEADLDDANLQEADLRQANLQEADLGYANLQEANLWRANLQKADLWAVKNLIQDQLDEACTDDTTTLPQGLTLNPMSPEQREECVRVWPDSFKP